MRCPRDNSELQSTIYEKDISVETCDTCGGVWLTKEQLEIIQEIKEHDYTEELSSTPDLGYGSYRIVEQKTRQPILCPLCDIEMESREYARSSQIMIDVCPKCHGIWLDKMELEALELFYERARMNAD